VGARRTVDLVDHGNRSDVPGSYRLRAAMLGLTGGKTSPTGATATGSGFRPPSRYDQQAAMTSEDVDTPPDFAADSSSRLRSIGMRTAYNTLGVAMYNNLCLIV